MTWTNNETSTLAGSESVVGGAQGAAITSAATITVTDFVHTVSGAATITTISGGIANGLYCLIPAAGSTWSLNVGGNIDRAVTPTAGIPVLLILDGTTWRIVDGSGLSTRNINVRDYGAVGDGATDDTTAIQNAITVLTALGGGTLYFPPGNYAVTTVPTATYSPVSGIFSLTGLKGVTIDASEATITDLTVLYRSASSITNNGAGVATVTTTAAHGWTTGTYVQIGTATVADYNIYAQITVTGPTTFTYPMAVIGAGAAAAVAGFNLQAVCSSAMFVISNCTNVSIRGDFNAPRKSDYNVPQGLHFIELKDGTRDVDVLASFDGGYAGLVPHNTNSAGAIGTAANRSSNIHALITADHVERPYFAYYSGRNCDIWITADTSGRDFLILGAENNDIHVITKNAQGGANIDGQSGVGNENISVWLYDHDTDLKTAAQNPNLLIQFTDATAITQRNIKVVLDVIWTGVVAGIGGAPLTINVVVPGSGYILDGLDVSGTLEPWASKAVIAMATAFAAPDIVRNVRLHDITNLNSTVGMNFAAGNALADALLVDHCRVKVGPINVTASTGRVIIRDTTAYDLVKPAAANRDNTDLVEYVNSTASSGLTTSFINKRIVNTKIGTVYYNPASVGADLASADPIVPTAHKQRVSGVALIKNITQNSTAATDVYFNDGDTWTVLPTGAFTWDATGNIVVAGAAVVGKTLTFTWYGTKWYPSYV